MGKSEVLDDAIASFAMAYADQTAVDYAALVTAKSPVKASKPVTANKRTKAAWSPLRPTGNMLSGLTE